ncbi:energy-coupling factor transport system permease protein [Sediminihabitans luteus]|uniref:Energy-coupling factor transport system permease protein n=1 Tax=Sediminihabitans luteus TaxID=1138585 RepID=A0A2M9CCR8_9CELL|nr:energy-coupling factor transporter transmembrane component T [Sediminihabitans luteus]PJJ69182.1 energy-coupling factor transport system permease protein [Sediminihabitans luteus]GII98857.1 cobalt ABC transporter permease [Sediminihabitans luteus]
MTAQPTLAPIDAPRPAPKPAPRSAPKGRRRGDGDGLSVEWVKLELMRVAYATRGGFLAHRDPRAVLGWYVVCGVAPWLTYSTTVLALLFVLALGAALAARIGPLLLGLFALGLAGQAVYVLALVWFLGGDPTAIEGIVTIQLKLGAVSLVSMAAFVSLDPEKLSDALLALRAPAVLGFGVSYGYRMVPLLIDEFHTIIDGHRLRGAPARGHGLLGWRTARRVAVMTVQAFYPLMLNAAKRTRTTVEALETRGFTYAAHDDAGRRIRLAHLRIGVGDVVLLVVSVAVVVAAFVVGAAYPGVLG